MTVARNLFGEEEIATQPPGIAIGRGVRRVSDRYYTVDRLALAICGYLADYIPEPKSILEPGCGGGAFLRAAHATWPDAKLLGIDLAPACSGPGEIRKADFFEPIERREQFSLIVGNPPFRASEEFILRAMELVPDGGRVAFLLRIALAAGRRKRLDPYPLLGLFPVVPRPSFTGGGSDKAQEYAVLLFEKGRRGDFFGRRLVWKAGR